MRARWEETRSSLLSDIHATEANPMFTALRRGMSELAAFETIDAFLDFMHEPNGAADRKDRLLRELVHATRDGAARHLAWSLLFLALWPGLDAIYRRRLHHFLSDPDALVSEITVRFTEIVSSTDLSGVTRVAATFVMNLERDIKRRLHRERRTAMLRREVPEDERLGGEFVPRAPSRFEPFVTGPTRPEGVAEAEMAAAMKTVIGDDAEALLAVILDDESQRRFAERLGISEAAARKRWQRYVAKLAASLSHSACPPGVSPKGPRIPSKGDHR